MKLWLIRHAQARSPSHWLGDDTDRPLTEEGIEFFQSTAKNLAVQMGTLGAILCSPAERCRHTAELLAEACESSSNASAPTVTVMQWLQIESPVKEIIGQIEQYASGNSEIHIAIIAHQPELEELYEQYTKGGQVTFSPGQARSVVV